MGAGSRRGAAADWSRATTSTARSSEALALHEETLDVFEAARTELAYGARLRRAGRRVDARGQLRRALTTFAALGAEPWADQAAVELDLTGERVPRRARWAASRRSPRRSCRSPCCSPTAVRPGRPPRRCS